MVSRSSIMLTATVVPLFLGGCFAEFSPISDDAVISCKNSSECIEKGWKCTVENTGLKGVCIKIGALIPEIVPDQRQGVVPDER